MKVSRYAKWIVTQGSEGFTVDLTPEDIGMSPAGDINVALEQIRILMYLTTYVLYSRMRSDGVMEDKMFAEVMAKFEYEHNLVDEYIRSVAADKAVVTPIEGPTDRVRPAPVDPETAKVLAEGRALIDSLPDPKVKEGT